MAIFTKSAGLADSIFGKSQDPIKKFIIETENVAKKESVLEEIFNVMPLDTYAAKFGSMTGTEDFEAVGESGEYPESSPVEGFSKTIEPDTWKAMRKVSLEMIEDATMFSIRQKFSDFAPDWYRTREKFAAAIINAGNATSMTFGKNAKNFVISGADTLALFSTAHTKAAGARSTSTQSNYFDATFSYDNLCRVEELAQKITDDDGEYMGIQPDTIVIPNNARIKRLVADAVWTKGDEHPNTADHGYSYQAGRWKVITWNYLTNYTGITAGTDMWLIMDSRRNAIDGLMFCDRKPLAIKSFVDEYTDNNIWAGRGRFSAAPVNWRSTYMCAPGLGSSIA
jgi:hypothetical protein